MIVNLEIEPLLRQMLDRGEMESLLVNVRKISHELLMHTGLNGRALFLPQLDALMRDASRILVQPPAGPADRDLMVHVATEVYETGGHTRVIEDVVKIFPGHRHMLILTDAAENYHSGGLGLGFLKERYEEAGLEVTQLRGDSLTSRAGELAGMIAALAPQAVLLFAHHFDSIANAAVSGASAPHVLFVHHCDHNPSLGPTRDDFVHFDLSPPAYELCKTLPGLRSIFLGLSVPEHGLAVLTDRSELTGVTCATAYKYTGRCEFTYAEFVSALFAGGVTRLFHIGEMALAQQEQIRADINALGQDAGRIVFTGNTPDLAQNLKELAPDFFLCSYPKGGGKAMIEAMSLGLPTISPRAPSTLPLVCADMSLGVSLTVKHLEDVPAALDRLRTEKKELGRRNREMFERHYSLDAFRQKLFDIISA